MTKVKFLKGFVALVCFVLAFSIISPSLAFASESQDADLISPINQETVIVNESDNDTKAENLEIIQDETTQIDDINPPSINNEIEAQPYALPVVPLLAGIVIKKGVEYIVKTSAGRIVKISAHAADQAVARKITGEMIDQALSNGTKYVDILSGERISWLDGAPMNQRTAVLLNKNTDVIDTVYDQKDKKLKWFKSNWQYKGDIK
ncbi:hypothetical protein MHB44_22200 [Lysinibacillus sp. FSL H8-0500]|uniref:Uncharacterized protein n=1 Tax=Lysinibacillus macroides TaxID=33935 RepID=A0A0N0CUD5_9BACI|nr:hypothetical protein [Lysinibacillus macroides]KOY80181.1 hypothetical protein ADM90_23540 [Lysinibacillus macroides]QPR67472.1 hypothetical protein I6G82_19990 [Lysinibacillus macroides]